MNREQFLTLQTRLLEPIFSLTNGESDSRSRFEHLALDTYDFFISQHGDEVSLFSPYPRSARNLLNVRHLKERLSPSLLRRWEDWKSEYNEIAARNPSLELRDAMQEISESEDASSWPVGKERHIQVWVDVGDPTAPPPFRDRYNIATPEFFRRLRELRQRCGGWLYWNDEFGRVVFAPEPEWQKVRAEQETTANRQRRDIEEMKARRERSEKWRSEILIIARSDTGFWNELKTWELEQEAKRPAELSKPTSAHSLFGPIRIPRVPKRDKEESRYPPVDPIFAEFISRTGAPKDALATFEIICVLRLAVRRELGLDESLGSIGGSGTGAA